MADFERLVQELIEAAVREGEAAATFTKPMQHYYNATHAAKDALMGAIDKATSGVPPSDGGQQG